MFYYWSMHVLRPTIPEVFTSDVAPVVLASRMRHTQEKRRNGSSQCFSLFGVGYTYCRVGPPIIKLVEMREIGRMNTKGFGDQC